uniref:Uncharacterized protein n=1 Tax=Pavo cristatus TaxID=9049 RepID=A0A8C9F979_PAVCR
LKGMQLSPLCSEYVFLGDSSLQPDRRLTQPNTVPQSPMGLGLASSDRLPGARPRAACLAGPSRAAPNSRHRRAPPAEAVLLPGTARSTRKMEDSMLRYL